MKRNPFFIIICLVAALLLPACSQDEPGTPAGEAVGALPLQIGRVSLAVEPGGLPQKRVAESTDGSRSVWQAGDVFQVKFDGSDEAGTYRITDAVTGAVEAVTPLYWQDTEPAGLTARYTAPPASADGTIDLGDQSGGLAYVLHATADATYGQSVILAFAHRLAKVRVELDGTQARRVTQVEVNNHTRCRDDGDAVAGAQAGWIQMHRADATTWEANVVPGTALPVEFIRLNATTVAQVSGLTELAAGAMHTIALTVGEEATPITADNCSNLNGTGNYIVSGGFGQAITVTGGSPNIYLQNANISVGNGNAIHIKDGNPTIHVQGTSSVSSSDGAGIYVAPNNTVTITGESRDDILTVTGGDNGCAIGGYMNNYRGVACGDINISTVTIVAYAGDGAIQPGIGGMGANCGRITITDAKVTAYGMNGYDWNAPAIGTGMDYMTSGTVPTITISDNSEVHAHRGLYSGRPSTADYIGNVGNSSQTPSATGIQVGTGGSIINSTIYCYTGNGNTVDKIVVYDASGNATEQ